MKRNGMVVNAKNFKCGRKMIRAAIRDGNAHVRRWAKSMDTEQVVTLGLVVTDQAGGVRPHLAPEVVRAIHIKKPVDSADTLVRRIALTYRWRYL